MVVEHAHGLRQRRGPNAKSSLHKAHLAPDAGLPAPGASLSFAQGSHDFESLDRGIGRGDRFETDRTRVGEGKSVSVRVDLGGVRIIKKTKEHKSHAKLKSQTADSTKMLIPQKNRKK